MQYRSGDNPSEPLHNEVKSSTWKFILRNAYYPTVPRAFVPHTNYVAWIAQPQGASGRWLIRGYCQWTQRRNYYVLKSRYSRAAEWIPVPHNDMRPFNEFTYDPIPRAATRFIEGVPLSQSREKRTIDLHRVGMNIEVPDLIEEYTDMLFAEEVGPGIQEIDEEEPDEATVAYFEELDRRQQAEADYIRDNNIRLGTFYGRPTLYRPN